MSPRSMPNASSRTLIIGTKQLVVHDALETTVCAAGSKVSSLTPITKVASAPVAGAEMITRGAPASRWAAALSRSVKMPVDSMTTSTLRSPHGSAFGSRSANPFMLVDPTAMPSPVTLTSSSRTPWVLSYFRRWALISGEVRSLTATTSTSAPALRAARKKFRPMRPKPLMPTRIAMSCLCLLEASRSTLPGRSRPAQGAGEHGREELGIVEPAAIGGKRRFVDHDVGIDAMGLERLHVRGGG